MSYREFLDEMAELVEMDRGQLTGSEKLEDLGGWTSIAMVSYIALADDRFGKTLSPRDIRGCQTVQDLAKLVGLAV